MLVEGGQPGRNLARTEEMIHQAASTGCRAVILPECLDVGWTCEEAPPSPSRFLDRGRKSCAGRRVWRASTWWLGSRRGAAIWSITPRSWSHQRARFLLHYRQDQRTGYRQEILRHGGPACGGQNLHRDRRHQHLCRQLLDSLALGHSLARMGCQILFSPCAWAVDAGHDNAREPYGGLWKDSYCTLARLYEITVIGVSNVGWLISGPWKGRKCIGCSLAVGPVERFSLKLHTGSSGGAHPSQREAKDASRARHRHCTRTGQERIHWPLT